ncbi:hypothetical protein L4C36_23815 [Photobacterium japonica]|uniref:hypothetical protein n=1 Tax=Photobacterium japonica TaxID=2910235 RepID=UPI003D0B5BA9
MINSIRLGVVFFFIAFFPSLLIVFTQYLILDLNCDSKVGCTGSFIIMTVAIAYLSFLSAFAIVISDYIHVYKSGCSLSGMRKIIVLTFGFLLGLSINVVFYMLDEFTVKTFVLLYFLVPFIFVFLIGFYEKMSHKNTL